MTDQPVRWQGLSSRSLAELGVCAGAQVSGEDPAKTNSDVSSAASRFSRKKKKISCFCFAKSACHPKTVQTVPAGCLQCQQTYYDRGCTSQPSRQSSCRCATLHSSLRLLLKPSDLFKERRSARLSIPLAEISQIRLLGVAQDFRPTGLLGSCLCSGTEGSLPPVQSGIQDRLTGALPR